MSFAGAFRRFFRRRGGVRPQLQGLARFASERKGVEGYIEPRTATNPTTLLLVDRDGEYVRGPVDQPRDAAAFCERLGIPIYDASVIGYPSRMKGAARRQGARSDNLDEAIADLERRLAHTDPNTPDH